MAKGKHKLRKGLKVEDLSLGAQMMLGFYEGYELDKAIWAADTMAGAEVQLKKPAEAKRYSDIAAELRAAKPRGRGRPRSRPAGAKA
jgi:hypothetical protein